jgi:integrase
VQGEPFTLAQAAEEYLAFVKSRRRRATLHCYQTPIRAFVACFPGVLLAEVSARQIDRFSEAEGRRVAVSSLRLALVVLRAMFGTFARWGYVQVNPVSRESFPRLARSRPSVLEPEEVRALLAKVQDVCPSLRGLVAVALYAGLRRGEALNLEWDDIREETVVVRNKPEHPLKDFEDRQVPMHPELGRVLGQLPHNSRWCFPAARGGRWHGSDANVVAARAGVPGFHILRRTFATSCLRGGVDIRTVQAWLGHASLATTELYLSRTRPDEASLIARLNFTEGGAG